MKKHLLLGFPLALLMACGGGSNPEYDKMMADHKAMMAADSAERAGADQMKQATQQFLDMWQTGKSDGIEAILAENFMTHNPIPGVTTTGIQQMKDMITMAGAAFTDNKLDNLRIAVDGDRTIAHYHWTAMNSGGMGEGMPATNKPIDVYCVDILRFENGKAVEHWGYIEEMKMMEQLGMMPGPGGDAKK